jgi:hypothetical protein
MSPFEHTQRSRLGDSANKAEDMNTPFPRQAAIDASRRAAREVFHGLSSGDLTHESQAQWVAADQGRMFLTNKRFAIQGYKR